MSLRKFVVAFAILAMLAGSVEQSKAFVPPPTPAPAGGTSVGAGIYVAGGIIGVAAFLCAYDLYLKINGLKNWDGTPKKGITPRWPF